MSLCEIDCLKKIKNGVLICKCDEENIQHYWNWKASSNNVVMFADNYITFHPVYSSGTAVIRGDKQFLPNNHYYWEMKLCSQIYGTDIMIGVGTKQVSLTDHKYRFCSLLGLDEESYGYSYQGFIQHNKIKTKYGGKYGLGCLVGIHLDMHAGTLEFYLNKKPLGVAFTNLKNKELYPMVCSTTANSTTKIINSFKCTDTLQLRCLKLFAANSNLVQQFYKIPGLKDLVKNKYTWLIPCEKPLIYKSLFDLLEKQDKTSPPAFCATYLNDYISTNGHFQKISSNITN